MKKSILTLAAVVVFSATCMPAVAAVGGTNPRPQAASGTDSTSAFVSGAYAAVVALFGF